MAPRAAAFILYLSRYLFARKREALLLRHVTERAPWRHALSQNVSPVHTNVFMSYNDVQRKCGSTSRREVLNYRGERSKHDMSCTQAFATNKFFLGQTRSTLPSTSVLEWDGCSRPRPDRLTPGKTSGTYCTRRCLNPRTTLDRRRKFRPHQGIHCSSCELKFMSPACSKNFAEVGRNTYEVQQAVLNHAPSRVDASNTHLN